MVVRQPEFENVVCKRRGRSAEARQRFRASVVQIHDGVSAKIGLSNGGLQQPRIVEIFRHSDIDHRHLYIKGRQKRKDGPTELNLMLFMRRRGNRRPSLKAAELEDTDVDLRVPVCKLQVTSDLIEAA
jgi:hypothetical protein